MLESEVVEQGLEDGELGLQGAEMFRPEGGAVSGVGGLERGAVLEGGEANAAAGGHGGWDLGGREKDS